MHSSRTELLRTHTGRTRAEAVQMVLFGLFIATFAFVFAGLCFPAWAFNIHWLHGLLVLLAAAATLHSLAGYLPIQNVIAVTITLLLTATLPGSLGRLTSLPIGPDGEALTLLHPLPWLLAAVWLTVILNARGVAQLILRPRREAHWYGFYLLGLSVALVTLFALGFEPFAVRQYYSTDSTNRTGGWFGVSWLRILGWAAGSFVALVAATPWLIDKKPMKTVECLHPLVVWPLLNLLLVAGAVLRGLWVVALLVGVGSLFPLLVVLRVTRKPRSNQLSAPG